MKNTITRLLGIAVSALLLLSCQDRVEEYYTVLEPEYMSYSDLRDAFQVKSAEDIMPAGKDLFQG